MAECSRCLNQIDNHDCAFLSGIFSADNHRCGTLLRLREIAGSYDVSVDNDMPNSWRVGDSSLAVMPFIPKATSFAKYIILTWYKSRGRTSQAYVMSDDDLPSILALADAEWAIEDFERYNK